MDQVSRQELLQGGLVLSEKTVTVVLCDDVLEVEALYESKLVDAKVIPRGGSTMAIDPGEVRIFAELGWSQPP